jgi:cytochrome bd-type quinol oxidase subunit 2
VKALDAWLGAHPRTRIVVLTVYYLAIIAGLVALYGRGDFSTPPFVYQEF